MGNSLNDNTLNISASQNLQIYDSIDFFYNCNRELYREISSDFRPPELYLRPYKNCLVWKKQKITFSHNDKQPVHRWAPYTEGFSFSFIKDTFEELKINQKMIVLDPFSGSGTLSVGAKMLGVDSVGVEKNPFMAFVAGTKLIWDIDILEMVETRKNLSFPSTPSLLQPDFMYVDNQFNKPVLNNLLRIKEAIYGIKNPKIMNLFKLAFSSLIMECSNLKRSPSIGYDRKKKVADNLPFTLFQNRIQKIIEDLEYVQSLSIHAKATIYNEDSREFVYQPNSIDYAITSPPYLNAMDYIGNYKLEIAWLDFAGSVKDFKNLRDGLVVCDNVSKVFLREASKSPRLYQSNTLDYIENKLSIRMKQFPKPRRDDYPLVVRKYFEDLYRVMKNTYNCLKPNGVLVMVVGDSLIFDTYVPTDLILAEIGQTLGFKLDKLVVARHRRSGIRRSFKLRETVAYLKKTL